MSIYLYKNNQRVGPYEEAAVREWVQNGQLSPNDLAIREGEADWASLEIILKQIDWERRLQPYEERLERGMEVNKAFRSMKRLLMPIDKSYEHLKEFGYKKHSSWAKEDLRAIDVAKALNEKAEREEILFHILENENKDEYDFYVANESDVNTAQKKFGCFIATAAYGSPLASEVIFLSRFRDDVLLNSKLGALFVSFYYRSSPPLAMLIAKADFLRAATRTFFLAPILHLLKVWMFKH